MMRKEAINLDNLAALGAEKLAQLVKDEAVRDSTFRKLVTAALSVGKGPKSIVAVVDRRLGALETANTFIRARKIRDFADDKAMLVKIICDELASVDPMQAIARLVRLLAGSAAVLRRIDDPHERMQDVYRSCLDALAPIAARISEADRNNLPDLLLGSLPSDDYDYLLKVLNPLIPHIPANALKLLDGALAQKHAALTPGKPSKMDWIAEGRRATLLQCRQAIATWLGDVDVYIELETTKPASRLNTIAIATMLLQADRPREALQWVRNIGNTPPNGPVVADTITRRVRLEAKILEALQDRNAAQNLRWAYFEQHLSTDILRDYIAGLDDFDEFDALDRAFAVAESQQQIYRALSFLVQWPKLDKAAQHVCNHIGKWRGELDEVLAPAAKALEETQPAAATILYRALLNYILTANNSHAYAEAARYLVQLDAVAPALETESLPSLESPSAYRARLANKHGKKLTFWALVQQLS